MLFRSNDTATTEIYTQFDTLSLHDALPVSVAVVRRHRAGNVEVFPRLPQMKCQSAGVDGPPYPL